MEKVTVETERRRIKPIYIILPLVLLIGGFFGYKKIRHATMYESTDNAQIESNAVPVISRVAGYIDSVAVSDYAEVKPGQLVVKLDDREYQIAVSQAQADLAQAQADLATARAALSTVGSSENVASANADVLRTRLRKAEQDLGRDEALFADGAITRKQLDDSRSNVETARKQLVAGNQQTVQASVQGNTANAQIQKAQALIETRKAALEKAKLQLTYVEIYAPAGGRIGKTNLQPGQFIQPGQPLFTVVNSEQFWVVANFKETQLKSLKLGQPVEMTIAGYPDRKLTGKITSFSEATGAKFSLLPPDNASGNYIKVTQRVPVRIDIDNVAQVKDILKAGLSVDLDVKVK
ncbi:HlyD family secretion protein [Flavisolibacter nicotianae]|uniref:HlyD family secretion protein n=1 Tax=Flavisolibacter nicotianae TaxID=2364882 RepID=UPI000EAD5FDD|nr:HlyD family secretion protein [Flavisolibacter nicotianae]